MSYATLLVYVNADHVSKQLAGVAAGVADKFSANLVGLSALAVMPARITLPSPARSPAPSSPRGFQS